MALNPENPLVAAAHDNWHKIAGILIHKLKLPEVVITAEDVAAFIRDHPETAVLLHEKKDGLHIMLVTEAQAKSLVAQERVIDATPPQQPQASPKAPAPYQAGLTTDPTDPRLGHGVDDKPVPQNAVYLVLSEEERAKGFIRPLRRTYRHVGERPKHKTRLLTEEEQVNHAGSNYVLYEIYPESEYPKLGRFWTQEELKSGCGDTTTMGLALCETYARRPDFYGSTYCCYCQKHRPVSEFVWVEDGQVVGS